MTTARVASAVPATGARIAAVLVALLVLFIATATAYALHRLSQGLLWGNLLAHVAFMLVPVLWLPLTLRNVASYGLSFGNLCAGWQAAMTAYLPVALGAALCGFLDYRSWTGALILSLAQVAVLVKFWWRARLLHRSRQDV